MGKRPQLPADSSARFGVPAIAVSALLWAAAASVASDLFDSGVSAFELTAARAVVAAAGLAVLPAARRRRGRRPGAAIGLGVSMAFVTATYYLAIERLPVAVAIVLQYTAPILVVGWVALVARRSPGRRVRAAAAAAFVGVLLASEVAGGEIGSVDLGGVVFGLASAALFASYTLFSEPAGAAYGPVGAMLRAFAISSLVWVGYVMSQGWPTALFDDGNLPKVVFVGIGGTLIPFLLFVWAVQHVRPERAAVAATLEPLFAGLIAWTWLGQTLTWMQIAGGVLILAAVSWLQLNAAEPREPPQPAPPTADRSAART